MAFDSTREVSVLFGGASNDVVFNDTWAWDGNQWTLLHPGGEDAPDATSSGAMVYDSWRHVVILYVGGGGHDFFGDTWVWDGTTWTKVIPADPNGVDSPLPRWSPALAFDSWRGKTVLFGGYNGSYLNDTWELDYDACSDTWSWENVSPVTRPSARDNSAMSFDNLRGVCVLFGGFDRPPDVGPTSRDDETWEWDGETWTLAHPGGAGAPGPRNTHVMAFDSNRGVTLLYGGHGGAGILYPETWNL